MDIKRGAQMWRNTPWLKGMFVPAKGGGAIRRRGGRQRKYNSDIADEGSFKAPGSRNGGGVVDG